MAASSPLRLFGLLVFGVFIWLLYQIFQAPAIPKLSRSGNLKASFRDPNLDPSGEPMEPLHRVSGDNYAPENADSDRISATLLSLVPNDAVDGMVAAMESLERKWNHKFNYPWTFFNDKQFTQDFIDRTTAATNAKTFYEVIPKEHWEAPSWINKDLVEESAELLKEKDVQYATKLSYHKMCRWNSGMFYKHPALENIRYYWRVEPDVKFFCDVDYDVFRYMQDHNKTYGFNINIYDSPDSVATLWPETLKFLAAHPEYQSQNNAWPWLTDSTERPDNNIIANGYSTCHFWSNFEIGDMQFWRSRAYDDYFNHLDRAGGFFYERWGDAPVHSIGLGLFEDVSRIHWFQDIGYQHVPFLNCPNSPKCSGCTTGHFAEGEAWLNREDCRPLWFNYVGKG